MRAIYEVNATQVVVSENHPEGVYSVMPDYPKYFDSRNYPAADGNPNGNAEDALNAAKAEYHLRLSAMYVGSKARVMSTVTLTRANGRQIECESIGTFPDMTPAPEPTPEEQEQAE